MLAAIRRQLAGWLDPSIERRAVQLGISPRIDPSGSLSLIGGRITAAGVRINAGQALGITAFWSCVDLISSLIAASRLEFGREEAADEFIPDRLDPRYNLLRRRPNATIPKFHFWQTIVAHALTNRGGYAEIQWSNHNRDRERYPRSLNLMDPRSTESITNPDRTVEYRINAQGEKIPADNVIHIRGLGWNGTDGYDLVAQAAEILGVARAQIIYEGAVYGNGAQKGGHLEMPGTMSDPQREQLRQGWNDIHQGPANAGKVGILTGGAKWVDTTYSPADARMVEAQKAKALEIARIFRVPPHMIGLMDGATVGNAEEQMLQFLKTNLSTRMAAVEGELDLKLCSEREQARGYCTRHNTRNLERGNMAARIAYYQGRFALGSITPNEVRRAEGDVPFELPAADDAYIGTNNLTALRLVDGKPTQPAVNDPPPEPNDDAKADDAADGAARSGDDA